MPVNPWCRARGAYFGRGFWRRSGLWYDPFRQPSPAEEMGYLEEMARQLEEDLKSIKEQIDKLRSTQ